MVKAYLFDVDGVLTNPAQKKVLIAELFQQIIFRLKKKNPICFNTGRSLQFIEKEILDPLKKLLTDKSLLSYVFAIGEKGGVWVTYEEEKRKQYVDTTIATAQLGILQKEIQQLITREFSDIMFFDDTKETMISIEMHKEKSLDMFGEKQKELVEKLKMILQKNNLQNEFKIDPTTIATDIENRKVGKALGAKEFVDLLTKQKIFVDEYICFGDSTSDYEMFEQLQKLEKKVYFIFVGNKKLLENKNAKNIIFTVKQFDQGTKEYLTEEFMQPTHS